MLPDPITNQICYKNSYHIPDYTFGFNSEVDYMFTHKFDNMIDHNPNSNQHHTAKVMFLLTKVIANIFTTTYSLQYCQRWEKF